MAGQRAAQRSWRTPRQERSRHTVECVLAAAAQVFTERGYANTTTNHIAARAGVSIGSLYQYFPSKDAVLMALAERHVERAFATAMAQVRDKRAAPVPELLRALVDALVEAHQIEPRLHRVIFEEARLNEAFRRRLDELDARAVAVARELIDQRIAELAVHNPEMASFIVVQILEGLTHAMVIHHPKVLRTPEFRAEFVRLLEGYLLGDRQAMRATRRVRSQSTQSAVASAPRAGRRHAASTAPTARRRARPSE